MVHPQKKEQRVKVYLKNNHILFITILDSHSPILYIFLSIALRNKAYLYQKLGYSIFKTEKVNKRLSIVFIEKHRI